MFSMPVLALSALLGLAAAHPQSKRQSGLSVINNCYDSNQVALTFDDGPYQYEQNIADQFTNAGAKTTFFLNGNNYACIYDNYQTIRNLHAASHTLGSHTWSHADLTTISDDEINQELEKVETAFIKILGLKPIYFRPPYGSINQNVLNILAQRGYKKVFLWSADTGDSTGASLDSQKGQLDQVAASFPSPELVLMHSPDDTTPDEAAYAIQVTQNAGYQLVAVDTCLGGAGEWPYEYVGEPQDPDGSWYC